MPAASIALGSEDLAQYAREGNLKELKRAMAMLAAVDHGEDATCTTTGRTKLSSCNTYNIDVNAPVTKSEDTLLHVALSRNQKEIVKYLVLTRTFLCDHGTVTTASSSIGTIPTAAATNTTTTAINMNATNKQGVTPLMKAVVSCPDLVELLLQHGADPTRRNWKGGRHKTAIDLAGNNRDMKKLLQQYVTAVVTKSGSDHSAQASPPSSDCSSCPHCGVMLKKRTRLDYMLDSTPAAAVTTPTGGVVAITTNPYIDDFRASPACHALVTQQELYHVLTNKHHLRKEITESWAVLTALRRRTSESGEEHAIDLNDVFLVDLCSGSALTVALFGILYPESKGLAVDIMSEEFVAHLQGHLSYWQADIWNAEFLQALQDDIVALNSNAILVGMHLCGELSIRAIEIFAHTPSFQVIVLCPCCFPKKRPKKKEPRADNSATTITNHHAQDDTSKEDSPFDFTYGSDEGANYNAWSSHLLSLLSKHCTRYSLQHDTDMLSKRNAMIVGYR